MKLHGHRADWTTTARAAAGFALSVSLASVAFAAGEAPFPMALEDPVSGTPVEVAFGPRALHVVFLATWCQPCVDELPRLSDLEARWGPLGYKLVLVAIPTRQSRERLVKFLQEKKPPGQLLFDPSGAVERALSVEMLPTHVVFDREGKRIAVAHSLSEGVDDAIESLLSSSRRRREKSR